VRADGTFESGPSSLSADDLYVRDVGSSRIRNEEGTPEASGPAAAYGVHVTAGASAELTGATLESGGFGFYVAGGELSIRRGLLREQLDAAGATSAGAEVSLEDVVFEDNARDAVVENDRLPEATALPPPTAVER